MSDKDDDTGIDWAEATDEQLAKAAAELKKRIPLTGFDNLKWSEMNDTEFANAKEDVFKAMRQYGREQRILREHAEYESGKESRDNA